jgi:predicted ATP-grasp superfamily ATP-dependent carboligase
VPVPSIVKPAGPVGALATARALRSRADLEGLVAELPATEQVLVQEEIRGRLASLALVIDREGRVVARFQEEARRTWPREVGSFALTVSVMPDEELVERSRAMLAGAGYWGLAQLDFVSTAGSPMLIDVNPRFYACMPLALACGVNLPAAWHAVVEGGPLRGVDGHRVEARSEYPTGRVYRWLEGDLYAARRGEVRALLRRGRRPSAGAMWAPDDPIPGVLLGLGVLLRWLARRVPRRRSRGR